MVFLFILLTLFWGFSTYYAKYKLDDDFLSIKIYQQKYDLIKSRGVSYDEYMRLYYKGKQKFIYLSGALTVLSFVGVFLV